MNSDRVYRTIEQRVRPGLSQEVEEVKERSSRSLSEEGIEQPHKNHRGSSLRGSLGNQEVSVVEVLFRNQEVSVVDLLFKNQEVSVVEALFNNQEVSVVEALFTKEAGAGSRRLPWTRIR